MVSKTAVSFIDVNTEMLGRLSLFLSARFRCGGSNEQIVVDEKQFLDSLISVHDDVFL